MSDVTQNFAQAKIELGQRLELNLESPEVLANLQYRYQKYLKQQIAPGSNLTGEPYLNALNLLGQISRGENPVQNIIDVALTGNDAVTRARAEDTLRLISSLPDVRSTVVGASRRPLEAPKF